MKEGGTHGYLSIPTSHAQSMDILLISLPSTDQINLKIVLEKGLYHIINTEPDAHHAHEVVSSNGSGERVPLEAFGLLRYLSAQPTG